MRTRAQPKWDRSKRGSAIVAVACTLGFGSAAAHGADWPNFRGPHHDGICLESGLRVSGKDPLPLVWQQDIGSAFSSFAVVGDRVYTCGTKSDKQYLFCLRADDGRILWETAIEPAYENTHGSGTRATPTVHDGKVYILGAHGRWLCVDAASGTTKWTYTLHNPPTWGYAGSILVQGDLAIATGGHQDGALLALDRQSGVVRWRCGTDAPGYATPYPFTFHDKNYVLGFSGESAVIAEAATGRLALRIPWSTAWQVNAAAPIVHDDYLFLSSGYQTGCGLFRLTTEADALSTSLIWQSRVLRNKFQSCIYQDGYLYASDQRGLKCVRFLSGEAAWSIPRIQHGTLVPAQNHLFLLTEHGELQVAERSPKGFEPTLTAEILSGRCWTVPVISGGRLFARSLERVVCFDLRR
ncbi:MAG: PQQ-binding-like beta-propeller repeat protein [Phycisphaerae bacterium]